MRQDAIETSIGAARRSDVWVVRHVWDTEEQIEVLAAHVAEALSGADEPGDHPRARGDDRPDPESLARDLEQLEHTLGASPSASQLAVLRDRLGVLASRSQWVQNAAQRSALDRTVGALFERLDELDASA